MAHAPSLHDVSAATLTLGSIARQVAQLKRSARKKHAKSGAHATRHVKLYLSTMHEYRLIRDARAPFRDCAQIDALERAHALNEHHLCHFKHRDPHITRTDASTFLYVAAYRLADGQLVKPHQEHYKQIYKNAGRTESARGDSLMTDGTPYWTDAHLKRVRSEQRSKRLHQQRRKKQKIK